MIEETTSNVNKQAENVGIIDSSHPYHLQASDSPGMTLVHSIFDGKGFPRWRRSVVIAFSAKKKLGFINGVCKPPDQNSPEFSQWSCCNDMVTSWLLNSLSKDIGDSVIYSKTAKELWDSLEHRFGKTNGAKLFHLQKDLNSFVQGNADISGYFTKMERIWDEFDSLNSYVVCNCKCICDGKNKLSKLLENQRLMQFLMGLKDVYAQARGNILMLNPLPGIDYAYSLLLQDENQREPMSMHSYQVILHHLWLDTKAETTTDQKINHIEVAASIKGEETIQQNQAMEQESSKEGGTSTIQM